MSVCIRSDPFVPPPLPYPTTHSFNRAAPCIAPNPSSRTMSAALPAPAFATSVLCATWGLRFLLHRCMLRPHVLVPTPTPAASVCLGRCGCFCSVYPYPSIVWYIAKDRLQHTRTHPSRLTFVALVVRVVGNLCICDLNLVSLTPASVCCVCTCPAVQAEAARVRTEAKAAFLRAEVRAGGRATGVSRALPRSTCPLCAPRCALSAHDLRDAAGRPVTARVASEQVAAAAH